MAVTPKGTATSSATTSVTIPTHAPGDLIVLVAYNKSAATVPTKPSASGTVPAWVTIDTGSGNTNGNISAYFVATASNHTSGTWTSATGMVAVVLTGQSPTVLGGHARGNNASSLTITGHAITLTNADGSSAVLAFWGKNNAITSWGTATGYTDLVTDTTGNVALASETTPTSGAAINRVTTGTAGVGSNDQIEIVSGPHPSDSTTTSELVDSIIYDPVNTAEFVNVLITTGNDLNVNVSDSTSTSENVVVVPAGVLIVSVSDSTSTSEHTGESLLAFVVVSDSTTLSERISFPNGPVLFQPINTAEFVNVQLVGGSTDLNVHVSDSISTSENVAAFEPFLAIGVSDTTYLSGLVPGSPLIPGSPLVPGPPGEFVAVTVFTPGAGPQVNASDSTSISENVKVQIPLNINVSDSTATSENEHAQMSDMTLSVSDSTSTSENRGELLISFIDVTDSTATFESGLIQESSPAINVSDSTSTSEHVSAVESANVSTTDSTATSEWVVIALEPPVIFTLEVDVSDSTSTSENVGVSFPSSFQPAVSDPISTSEHVNVTVSAPQIAVSDSTHLTEALFIGGGAAPIICSPTTVDLTVPATTVKLISEPTTATIQATAATTVSVSEQGTTVSLKPQATTAVLLPTTPTTTTVGATIPTTVKINPTTPMTVTINECS